MSICKWISFVNSEGGCLLDIRGFLLCGIRRAKHVSMHYVYKKIKKKVMYDRCQDGLSILWDVWNFQKNKGKWCHDLLVGVTVWHNFLPNPYALINNICDWEYYELILYRKINWDILCIVD